MNSRRDKREELQSEARHKTIELVSNLVPYGNLAYKTFTAISKPLYIQRREEWIKDISLRLLKLEEQDKIKLEDLAGSDEFNTILIKASNLAQEHHQEGKINALKGIVINTSLDLSQDKEMFDWADHFLNVIERISPFHILLLKTFQSPGAIVREKGIDLGSEFNSLQSKTVFFEVYPEYKDRAKLITQCWKELYELGFVEFESFEDGRHMPSKLNKLTTDFGDKFLNMIRSDELTAD